MNLTLLKRHWAPGRHHRALVWAAWLGVALPWLATAQEASEPPPLPTTQAVAEILADPAQRGDALLTLAALARWLAPVGEQASSDAAGLVSQVADDRQWLTNLQQRFGAAQPRSPVLDPAAWQVQIKLEEHGLESVGLTSTLGPGREVFVAQAFNRFNPRLAAAVLPQLLWYLETDAILVWDVMLARAAEDQQIRDALVSLDLPAFAGPPGKPELPSAATLLAASRSLVEQMVAEAKGMGPPDPSRLARLRAGLFAELPSLAGGERELAIMILHLGRLVDGLNEHRFFQFTEGLLAISTQLRMVAANHPEVATDHAAWLADLLPGVSGTFARQFSGVDPRLNSTLAASFDVVRSIARPAAGLNAPANARQLANAVARLALLIPDMDYYFGLPVRDPVAGGVDACAGILAVEEPDGDSALTRELFDDCLQTLVNLAENQAREAQLAGDPDGPFAETYLQRELSLTSGQRINYGIGYLHDRYATGCKLPDRPLPNPLEWSYLATFMAWFSEQSPVYFRTPENEDRLARMRAIGLELMRVTAEQVDCIAGAGAGVNDPVFRVGADYRAELLKLGDGMRNAEAEFRAQFLAPGADVKLDGGAGQSTAYRPRNLMIGPCDPAQVCEMSGQLSSTRALLGLFPDAYLVAEQTGLGKVEICYDRMEWVDRRAEPVRADDKNVANYSGHLAFDLKGRYVTQGNATELFAFRFRSPQDHVYMFASAKDEVLEDSCPVEWIGQRIVTELPEGRRGIVPNRLTYLSAPRALPSRLLAANWERGAEWRDWFVTGIGVEESPVAPREDLGPRLGQHLQSLYRLQQEAVYGSVLQAAQSAEFAAMSPLNEAMMRLTTYKVLLRTQVMLFYPQILSDQDAFRTAVAGYDGLLDALVLNRFRDENVPVGQAMERAHERLRRFQSQWATVPEAVRRNGSIAGSTAQAIVRLNTLHERHFARAEETETPRVSTSTGL